MLNRWNFLKTGFYEGIKYEFLYYLRQRSTYALHFMADSELSLIGYHLKHKLFPDENYDMTGVDRGYGQLVDANFLASRGNWPHTEASERLFHTWQNESFSELLEDIKLAASEEPDQITPENLLFFLYDLAGKGADDLVRSVEELKRQTLLDGQEHSVRVPLARDKKGVTFVSFPTPTHEAQFQSMQTKLEAIGFAHKYKSQADEWMVLASFAGSPVRFDLFGYIRDPWQNDPEIDRWVEANLGPGIPVYPDGRKPSRNQDCPCGSGRKFKRCHGR